MVYDGTLVKCNAYFANPYVPAGQPGHLVLAQLTVNYTPTPRDWDIEPWFTPESEPGWQNEVTQFPEMTDHGQPAFICYAQNSNAEVQYREGEAKHRIIVPFYDLTEDLRETFRQEIARRVGYDIEGNPVGEPGPNHGLWYNGSPPYEVNRISRFNHWITPGASVPYYVEPLTLIMSEEDYTEFTCPWVVWPITYYIWTDWLDLLQKFHGDEGMIACLCKDINNNVHECTDEDHSEPCADYPYISNVAHEGYGYWYSDPRPGAYTNRLFGHQSRIEDYLINYRPNWPEGIIGWQESDANKLVEGIVVIGESEIPLRQADETERKNASERLYDYTQALHGEDSHGEQGYAVFLKDYDSQHNWAGFLSVFRKEEGEWAWDHSIWKKQ